MYEKYFDTLNRLGVAHECDGRMDGRTDRWPLANYTTSTGKKEGHAVFTSSALPSCHRPINQQAIYAAA